MKSEGGTSINDLPQFLVVRLALSPNSVRHVLCRWKLFTRWLDYRPPSPQLVEEFLYGLRDRGRNNNTLNTYVFAFRMVDHWLTDRHRPGAGFSKGLISLPKRKPPIDILTPTEIELLLSTHLQYGKFRGQPCDRLDSLYLCVTRFLATTGCRYGEAQSLLVRYVDLSNARVTFIDTKNKDWRYGYLKEPLITELQEQMDGKGPDDHVFTTMMGKPVPPQNYISDLKVRAKQCGITKNVHPHLFRHSFASDLHKNGVELGYISLLLGHKQIQTTMTYIHMQNEELRSAASHNSLVLNSLTVTEKLSLIDQKIKSLKIDMFSGLDYVFNHSNRGITLRVSITGPPRKGRPHAVGRHK